MMERKAFTTQVIAVTAEEMICVRRFVMREEGDDKNPCVEDERHFYQLLYTGESTELRKIGLCRKGSPPF